MDVPFALDDVRDVRPIGGEIVGTADAFFPFTEAIFDDVALEGEGVAHLIVDVEEIRLHVTEVDILVGKFDRIKKTREVKEIFSEEGRKDALVGIGVDFCGHASRTAQDVSHADDAHDEATDEVQGCRDVVRVFPVGHVAGDETRRFAVSEERDSGQGMEIE